MQNLLKRTNNRFSFGEMALIRFDKLCRSFVRSRLLPSFDHFHAGKFSSVSN